MNLTHTAPFADLEREMLKFPQAECSVRHMFAPGLYIREVTIPADTYVISHHHKHPHLNIFLRGSGTMVLPDGTHQPMQAPLTYVGQPGRKCGYVKEETVWINVFQTTETDVEKLEEMYFDKSAEFAEAHLLARDMKFLEADRDDYRQCLLEFGTTEEAVTALVRTEDDLIPFPPGVYKVKIGASPREGKGLIATGNISPGEVICAGRIGGKRTPAGRYTNHSRDPNARMVRIGDDIVLVAVKPIGGCRGGFDGEEVTVNYRDAVALNLEGQKS